MISGIYCSIIIDPGGIGATSDINRNKTKAMTKTIAPITVSPPYLVYAREHECRIYDFEHNNYLVVCKCQNGKKRENGV